MIVRTKKTGMSVKFTFLIFVLMYIGSADCTSSPQATAERNLTVGALFSLHGDNSNGGISSQIAVKIAEADINKLFSTLGRTIRVHVVVKDSQSDPNITLKAMKELQAQGIRIIIGPEESQTLSYVRKYANDSGIILISGSSTASSLAIKNDTTFRLVPDDDALAHNLAALMHRDGIKVIIPLARQDVWGGGMINSIKKEFGLKGGTMLDAVRYSPSTENFSHALTLLHSEVIRAVEGNGNSSVAVFVAAFDEIMPIFCQVNDDPILSSVRWYDCDTSAIALSSNPEASKFAVSTHFLFPTYGLESNPRYEQIRIEVKKETGHEADTFAVNDYDALWLITYTYLMVGSDDPDAFKRVFPLVAETYRGNIGWMKLNDAGDLENAPSTFVQLKMINDSFEPTTCAIL
jgi:branched-chain amino acid transport system substrate-binding protein